MSTSRYSSLHLLIAASAGAAITYGALSITSNDSAQRQRIASLEDRILDLEVLLVQKEDTLQNNQFFGFDTFETENNALAAEVRFTAPTALGHVSEQHDNNVELTASATNNDQILKDLATLAYGDPRSFSEKVNDFLSENPSKENVALASKSIFDLADNHDVLPDHSLESIYLEQTDPDLKRVVAQVASLRGDNSLLETQLNEMQKSLDSADPLHRQKTLVELGKTRYVGAANLVVPLLQDKNTGVKLDALLALRATGNQGHVRFVEVLTHHPDPSVSWLAKDVIGHLQGLSDMARTKLASSDIVAELPPITTQ